MAANDNAPTTSDKARMDAIRKDALRYSTPAAARDASEHLTKPRYAMLGDDEKIWLVRPVDAAWLEAGGFEYAW